MYGHGHRIIGRADGRFPRWPLQAAACPLSVPTALLTSLFKDENVPEDRAERA